MVDREVDNVVAEDEKKRIVDSFLVFRTFVWFWIVCMRSKRPRDRKYECLETSE